MNNIENMTSHASKSPYIKPLLIELSASSGTQGMDDNQMGNLKFNIGAEGSGMMQSPS